MTKRESIARCNLIINKLRKYPATFQEISGYLKLESEIQGYDFNISKRTFHRDLNDIRSIYNIDIQHDFSKKVYYIAQKDDSDLSVRILEAFDTFNALNISERLDGYIHFENRRAKGTKNLLYILDAVRNSEQISFEYENYWYEFKTERVVEPYALKEFANRWYLIAKELKSNKIKTFSLDRIYDPLNTRNRFQYPENFDVKEYFKDSYGIISSDEVEPTKVILSFDPHQGKYIKSLPLHHSQRILKDTSEELLISLYLSITYDFEKELLSFGSSVRIIRPLSLVKKMKATIQKALDCYMNKYEDVALRLNDFLEEDGVQEGEVIKIIDNLEKQHEYYINVVDIKKCQMMQDAYSMEIISDVMNRNFENASKLNQERNDAKLNLTLIKKLKIDSSIFHIHGNQLYYFCAGTAKNDHILYSIFKKKMKQD